MDILIVTIANLVRVGTVVAILELFTWERFLVTHIQEMGIMRMIPLEVIFILKEIVMVIYTIIIACNPLYNKKKGGASRLPLSFAVLVILDHVMKF